MGALAVVDHLVDPLEAIGQLQVREETHTKEKKRMRAENKNLCLCDGFK